MYAFMEKEGNLSLNYPYCAALLIWSSGSDAVLDEFSYERVLFFQILLSDACKLLPNLLLLVLTQKLNITLFSCRCHLEVESYSQFFFDWIQVLGTYADNADPVQMQ